MSAWAVATGLPRRLSRAAERFGARGSRASLGALTYRPSAGHPDPLVISCRLTTRMAIFSLFVPNRKLAVAADGAGSICRLAPRVTPDLLVHGAGRRYWERQRRDGNADNYSQIRKNRDTWYYRGAQGTRMGDSPGRGRAVFNGARCDLDAA